MELVLLRDIPRADGSLRFRRGETKDWPKDTWENVADQVGVSLEELAGPPAAVARDFLLAAGDGEPKPRPAKRSKQ